MSNFQQTNYHITLKGARSGKKLKIHEYYILGQNVATSSIHECVDLLLKRDYPEIVIFDGSIDGTVGPIFIPEGYLPKKPTRLKGFSP